MATHQSVEEILAKAREEHTKKLDAISALATARQAVITAEANHKKSGSPQIVEGLRLRGVRDGRRGGLLVIDR